MVRFFPRFLYLCITVFAFLSVFMIFDTVRECNNEELLATRKLLEKYSTQLSSLKDKHKELALKMERQNSAERNEEARWIPGLPAIYIITPTHSRAEQKADLTRMSHTLRLVKNIYWILIEDSETKTDLVTRFLKNCKLNHTHLNVLTPAKFKMASNDPNWLKPRGVLQRNAALDWLRNQGTRLGKGVVYFADDDNTYSLQIFEEMRFTRKASVWPVGLVGYLRYERPVVKNGKVKGWFTAWKPDRPFAMDMAGFAVNLELVLQFPNAGFSNSVQRGYQESTLLTGMQLSLEDLEPKANMCTEVLVWHTRTEKSQMKNEEKMLKRYGRASDPRIEV